MGYVKNIKDKAYFKRFQVKFQRRRAGKTDYRARLRLCKQAKNKYNTPKYRFSVRSSNRDICCQLITATIKGDIVVAAAYSHELPKYGLKAGLKNYAAAYCTGLLLARRVLKKFGLDEAFEGVEEVDGHDFNVECNGDKRPLTANLDLGLVRTTNGNRVFGALKGALDGGISIPHGTKRFAGAGQGDDDECAEFHRDYIFGEHVSAYMSKLEEEEPETYRQQFSSYIAAGIDAENLEDTIQATHEAIRADPELKPTKKNKPAKNTSWHAKKLTYDERRKAMLEKLQGLKAMDSDEESEEDDE